VSGGQPAARAIRRWRRYLADERAEAAVYRRLAERRTGEERAILLALAEAEGRHAAHWRDLLAEHADTGPAADPDDGVFSGAGRGGMRTRLLAFLARHFGSVFVLALAQRAEARSPYATDEHATDTMAADERIHGEVVRALAARGRSRLSGSFRAAVFGANDGLVSNLALVLGIGAAGASQSVVLLTGLAGLLAGALSMGAGEYVSVRSQRELLEASVPDPHAAAVLPHLDLDANELALVYRARGMTAAAADEQARAVLAGFRSWHDAAGPVSSPASDADARVVSDPALGATAGAGEHGENHAPVDEHEALGTAWRAAGSSFCFFASGAVIPVLPFLFGAQGLVGQVIAAAIVGVALLATGAIVGLLSGASPVKRAMRQLAIGYGAAAATYLLGLLFAV
jgi:VIT1/CCC1 family predicted Fe2+/Mn2+ transporter